MSPPSFPSKLWRETLTLWSAGADSRAAVFSASSVPLVVTHTRKPSSWAMASSSGSCGCSSGSPITWK